ncbi:MAG: hypothetical protein K1X92_03960 [Bacteroidia bacterium]|nr:hypothetical protein [Bacteroidia bacterium]
MATVITQQELYDDIMIIKKLLNKEIVKHRVGSEGTLFSQQEIYTRLDLIHEAERKGFRHLDPRIIRKLEKLISEIEVVMKSLTFEESTESED